MPILKRIGLLTGGGDCPGLNAVIRAVTKTAIFQHKLSVVGILDGFQGLVENRTRELSAADVSGILTRGGTILGTNNKCNPQRVHAGSDSAGKPIFENRFQQCLDHIEANRLDGLVVIGGDGTMSCAAPFVEAGVPCIGVPKTIDNDIVGTDICFGFMSAYATATMSLDRLHSTADSHHRVMVCEVMGRNAGWLALYAGVASGSDVILIPEIPYDIEKVCAFIDERMHKGTGFAIVVAAEGAKPRGGEQTVAHVDPTRPEPVRLGGIGERVAQEITQRTGCDVRTTVLGHVVRGGPPIPADRVLATQFGWQAIEMLMVRAYGRMVVMRDGKLDDASIVQVANRQRMVPLSSPIIGMARAVKTSFGD
jgi:phosphofructokinase-like protein